VLKEIGHKRGLSRFSWIRMALILPLALVVMLAYHVLVYGVFRDNGFLGVGSAAATPVAAATETSSDEPVAGIASAAEPSVVQINVESVETTPFGTESSSGIGSGVIFRKDGYIVTNAHVVEGASSVNVAFADGSTGKGSVVGTDTYTDLAVVKVDRNDLPAASFGDSGKVVVGQLAVAIGSPSGFQSTVTSGVISGLGREVSGEYAGGSQDSSLVDLIQTDAAISPGSSGGALLNRSGEVVGINVAYLPPAQTGAESIGFAIPSDTAADVAEQLIESGKAEHPYLGVGLADPTPEISSRYGIAGAESGAIVTRVELGGPADTAGLRAEDA
jgi:serine protease Do